MIKLSSTATSKVFKKIYSKCSKIASTEIERLRYLITYKKVDCAVIAEQRYSAMVRPELLKMAVGNLLKNAFQYTEIGQVTVTITAQHIIIADTGDGIPKQMLPQIFDRFERGMAEHIDGSGLGLSIVQRIMTHLDWQLSYASNDAGGSTFIVHYA